MWRICELANWRGITRVGGGGTCRERATTNAGRMFAECDSKHSIEVTWLASETLVCATHSTHVSANEIPSIPRSDTREELPCAAEERHVNLG